MIKTYSFYMSGVIPGIPGEWHAGSIVDVDEATMTVVGTRLMNAPTVPDENATSPLPDLEQSPDSSPLQEDPRKGK